MSDRPRIEDYQAELAAVFRHFDELTGLFRLAADMLEPDTSWPADEVAVVRERLRRLADNAP